MIGAADLSFISAALQRQSEQRVLNLDRFGDIRDSSIVSKVCSIKKGSAQSAVIFFRYFSAFGTAVC